MKPCTVLACVKKLVAWRCGRVRRGWRSDDKVGDAGVQARDDLGAVLLEEILEGVLVLAWSQRVSACLVARLRRKFTLRKASQ